MISWLLYITAWALAADALRRTSYQWVAADRQRGMWVGLLVLLGPFTLWVYLLVVGPRLLNAPDQPPAALRTS
ncbi:hypothetical protein ABEG17_08415 [Pedococcus sp. KACC 23699]|uniref:Cardiolipin synthase N-terminal domain-containing protein n=1 Tax=Pedococcus sp. KACC 23699 TaxID=3149228 RepID=A0AAU7JZQ4_9MICO